MKQSKELKRIKAKVQKLESLEQDLYKVCESLKYHDSSRFSFSVDKLREFTKYVAEFEQQNDAI